MVGAWGYQLALECTKNGAWRISWASYDGRRCVGVVLGRHPSTVAVHHVPGVERVTSHSLCRLTSTPSNQSSAPPVHTVERKSAVPQPYVVWSPQSLDWSPDVACKDVIRILINR